MGKYFSVEIEEGEMKEGGERVAHVHTHARTRARSWSFVDEIFIEGIMRCNAMMLRLDQFFLPLKEDYVKIERGWANEIIS